jgi:quercetin dioxygenase-like cupin family protein
MDRMVRATGGSDDREARQLMDRLLVYSLGEELARLRTEPAWLDGDRNTLALAKGDDVRVLLTTLRPGAALTEIDGAGPATVQLLRGRLAVRLEDDSDELAAGELAVLGGGMPWQLEALDESDVLLTLGWRPEWSDEPSG